MKKTVVFVFIFTSLTLLCLANTLTVEPQFQLWTYTTINADGSVYPPTAPIARNGNTFTLTGDIENVILLERNNTILDCAKHNVQGVVGPFSTQEGVSINEIDRLTNITVVNAIINNGSGIYFSGYLTYGVVANNTLNNCLYGICGMGSQLVISGNRVTNTTYFSGILAENSVIFGNYILGGGHNPGIESGHSNVIIGNYIMGVNGSAIYIGQSENNDTIVGNQIENNHAAITTSNTFGYETKPSTIYYNNFVNNSKSLDSYTINQAPTVHFWDNGTVGNYWSNYTGTDANSDGIGDIPYVLDINGNQDNHPIMTPVNISEILSKMLPTFNLETPEYPLPSPSPIATPSPSPSPTPTPPIPEFPLIFILVLVITGTLTALIFGKKHNNAKINKHSETEQSSK